MTPYEFLQQQLTYLKKVGPKRAHLLAAELALHTYGDLLNHYPRTYIDRSQVYRLNQIQGHEDLVTVRGTLEGFQLMRTGKRPRLQARFSDETGVATLVWFQGYQTIQKMYQPGETLLLIGKPGYFKRELQFSHPDLERIKPNQEFQHLIPVYPSTDKLRKTGLDPKGLRYLLEELLKQAPPFSEPFPPDLLKRENLIGLDTALRHIHFPPDFQALGRARRRLKFDEFFYFGLIQARRRLVEQPGRKAPPFQAVGQQFNTYYHQHLPFELTGAQKRVLKEIRSDVKQPVQMNRLVQGDVGSGKTMVAVLTSLLAVDNGYQTAVLAPTEVLAEQHFQSFYKALNPLGLQVDLLTGGQKKALRNRVLADLAQGASAVVIGTHALLEPYVQFRNLGLTIIDEQHKFGVRQRASLWEKAASGWPHNLTMTATPIPRTLAMTQYGDVEVSVIDELPPGRRPVQTAVRSEQQRLRVFGFLREQVQAGRQVYVVYPLVEESSKADLLALTQGFELFQRQFPDIPLGIVHGKMPSDTKDYEMQRFKRGETKILVATTVIEVGVDVPNATVMVIEHAERFGLSQLHQLRGRVGRGQHASYCILMKGRDRISEEAQTRLQALAQHQDGFKIAEIDLQLRGPGDYLGARQSGQPEFQIGDLRTDGDLITQARQCARQLIQQDPDLRQAQHLELRKAYRQYGQRKQVEIYLA